MNAPMTPTAPADDYQAEARRLVEWAFANAAYYKKHAPVLTDDIKGFEDIATVAPSMAGDEDTAVTLTDREGWGPVSMRGAATHGNIAGPSTVQSGYLVAEIG